MSNARLVAVLIAVVALLAGCGSRTDKTSGATQARQPWPCPN